MISRLSVEIATVKKNVYSLQPWLKLKLIIFPGPYTSMVIGRENEQTMGEKTDHDIIRRLNNYGFN